MSRKKPSLQEKIAHLRASFVEQLPERLEQAQQYFNLLKADPEMNRVLAVELHRAFHSLKGTGKSFGFIDLANAADKAEAYTQQLMDLPANCTPSDWPDGLVSLMHQVTAQIQILAYSDLKDAPANKAVDAPFFDVEETVGMRASSSSPLIYICDDEPEQVDYLAGQLQCFGYQIEHFTQIESFREAVLNKRPAAVIMDVFFPQGKTAGTDELASLKEITGQHLPSIVLSGREDFEARLSAVRAGCSAYFTKPAKPLELATAIDDLVCNKQEEPFRILVLDDEFEVANYHSLILEEVGMLVQQIHKPELVLKALRDFNPDLVMVDMYMPKCNGFEVAAIIRQVPEYVGLPIVFLSSETNRKKQFTAMQVGVEGFITKPVIPEELIASVAIRAERMRTLRALMAKDSLTGLYNHTTTTEMMSAALANAVRQQETFAVVMIDLDKFKAVNDNYGHMAGDQVIVAMARLLKHRLRVTDIIGRYGGEEFALLLKNLTPEQAEVLVNELREDFSRIIFNAGNCQFKVTFSAGVSLYPGCSRPEDLRSVADAALYQAKKLGRNQVVICKAKV